VATDNGGLTATNAIAITVVAPCCCAGRSAPSVANEFSIQLFGQCRICVTSLNIRRIFFPASGQPCHQQGCFHPGRFCGHKCDRESRLLPRRPDAESVMSSVIKGPRSMGCAATQPYRLKGAHARAFALSCRLPLCADLAWREGTEVSLSADGDAVAPRKFEQEEWCESRAAKPDGCHQARSHFQLHGRDDMPFNVKQSSQLATFEEAMPFLSGFKSAEQKAGWIKSPRPGRCRCRGWQARESAGFANGGRAAPASIAGLQVYQRIRTGYELGDFRGRRWPSHSLHALPAAGVLPQAVKEFSERLAKNFIRGPEPLRIGTCFPFRLTASLIRPRC